MENMNIYDLLCIGNYTKDTIISPSGTRYVDGGAINYAAHAANRLGLSVAVVTRLAQEDKRVIDKFNENGIDCYPTYTPASTTMKLEYPTNDPDIRTLSVASTAGSITPRDVENIATRAAVIGSSLRGEVGLDVIRLLRMRNIFLAADMQGFVRVLRGQSLVYELWEEMKETVANLDVLKSDAVEAEFLTGETDIYKAAKIFSQMGAKEIVLTHRDGLLLYAGGEFHSIGFYPGSLIGRSGRGDTCIGAYMAMRRTKDPYDAGIWAAALTSLKMEQLGVFNRSIGEIEELLRAKYDQVRQGSIN
jgi:sugar/nucleoside kinase (ribokinase family)